MVEQHCEVDALRAFSKRLMDRLFVFGRKSGNLWVVLAGEQALQRIKAPMAPGRQ